MAVQTLTHSFPRDEFLDERWAYRPGEHVTFLAPTQAGKTTLAKQLLDRTVSATLKAVVLVIKPRDGVVRDWGKDKQYKIVRSWPPFAMRQRSNPGWILWPRHSYDPDVDDPKLYAEFRTAILDSYRRGDRIIFADETYGLSELGLNRELITVWSRGASSDGKTMGCGLWAATQKPSHIPLWAYSQAEHIFLAHDPDRRARIRYAEIGGIDPGFVEHNVMRLDKYEFLYIRRTGPVACLVQA